MTLKCDVQYRKGDTKFKLTRVGVTGVRKPILVKRTDINNSLNGALDCMMDIFVDLPAEQKGSHLSRNVEVFSEMMAESLREPVSGLENMASDMCKKLLVHHEYAETAEVSMTASYFRGNKTPSGRETLEVHTLIAGAFAIRDEPVRKTIGVEVIGMTACPCAQETVVEMLDSESQIAGMSHNQRNICTLVFTVNDDVDVEANDMIDLVERSFSSPTYELLKRVDEGSVVINAHNNPKFVEDVVRSVLKLVMEKYCDLPDDTEVIARSESEESIHKHNAFAERVTTLGELKAEIKRS